jgi:ribokinase
MRVAVVGHCEWVEFVRVERLPHAGEIIPGTPVLDVAAGGGAVAAVQMARWGAETHFFSAFGDDELGHRALAELRGRGVQVHATFRPQPQRRALTLVDAQGERTILVLGPRLVAHGADVLPWQELSGCASVYITGGDVAALRAARQAGVVVASARILPLLGASGIALDALVGSEGDAAERYSPGDLESEPRFVVRTEGAAGGHFYAQDGVRQRFAPVPAKVTGDTYGAGDTFAAGLTFALGEGRAIADALDFAAARAAEVVTFQGPYPARTAVS